MNSYYQKLNSPVGDIYIATDGKNLRVLAIGEEWERLKNILDNVTEKKHPVLDKTKKQKNS
jgi:hypothetical protein